jgi:hypothetical protein
MNNAQILLARPTTHNYEDADDTEHVSHGFAEAIRNFVMQISSPTICSITGGSQRGKHLF